jgi:hypothetical protein
MTARCASPTAVCVLSTVRARARRLASWLEHLWRAGEASPDQGPAIGAAEVARLLGAEEARLEERAFLDAAAAAVFGGDPGWSAICRTFALTESEADLLALALAVEIDPGLMRVVAYLHDDGRLVYPTAWLAARLAGREPAPFAPTGLLRWRLAEPIEGDARRLMTPWQADPAVVLAVVSGDWRDPALRRLAPVDVESLHCLYPEALKRLREFADLRDAELVGRRGSGRETIAAQAAAARGRSLLVADLPMLLSTGAPLQQTIRRVLREAAITGAIAYFRDADEISAADWRRVNDLGAPYLRGVRRPTGAALPITLPPLTITARLSHWRCLSSAPPPNILLAQRLTPAEIAVAAASRTIVRRSEPRLDNALLTHLPCPYVWDDLVLSPEVLTQLHAFEAQVRLRWVVYEEWNFARLTNLGQGISALFGGPSGTGKTMAAQVLARALGLDLMRVDLASVVNKYIGETEKKLRDVFDSCEDSGALLFFDEADALFGTRTEVKDAHDRFANIEIDYLLQRIESFDGVAILATNRRQDLDSGFIRRLRFVVEFAPPRAEERLALWQRALAPPASNGEIVLDSLDWNCLAHRLPMTGAEIKSTALAAAFLARDEGRRIGMRHILAAAQYEMSKQGQRLRVPLVEAHA